MITYIEQKNGKYYPKNKLELKKLVEDEDIYLGNIDTSVITDMSELFQFIYREDFSGIESWDVSNVKNMSGMFYEVWNFNGDLSNWNINDKISIDDLCLENYPKNFTIPKDENGKYKPKKALALYYLVRNENIALKDIDTSEITNMSELFKNSDRQDFSGIERWDVSKVQYMSEMFCGAKKFNGDLSNWNVSNVKDMRSMFYEATNFNGDISGWNVSNVKDMSYMFYEVKNFNSDLSNWDVSNVEDMSYMFYGAKKFNSDISKWDVSNVENMEFIFRGAINFNSDISKWNISNVEIN